jgi:DNA-binding transcriptional LysR family regulator
MNYPDFPNNRMFVIKPDFMEARAFIAILEAGSFARAAKQLRLPPSRISELLRSFEERLGVRLVERTTFGQPYARR